MNSNNYSAFEVSIVEAKTSERGFLPTVKTFKLIWTTASEITLPLTVFLNLSPLGFLSVAGFFPSLRGFLCTPYPYFNKTPLRI